MTLDLGIMLAFMLSQTKYCAFQFARFESAGVRVGTANPIEGTMVEAVVAFFGDEFMSGDVGIRVGFRGTFIVFGYVFMLSRVATFLPWLSFVFIFNRNTPSLLHIFGVCFVGFSFIQSRSSICFG